jgi:uncharacterized protein
MENILITGGTGFIGSQLVPLLEQKGHNVFILTRQEKLAAQDKKYIHWNPSDNYVHESVNGKHYSIINLAGENIANERWTAAHKERVLKSRTNILDTLYMLCQEQRIECHQLLSASAIGFYGNTTGVLSEQTEGDDSFLSQTCQTWEKAATQFKQLTIKTSIVRIGVVLGKNEGAFPKFIATLPFKFVGIPGNGNQIFPWIHVQDVAGIFLHLYENNVSGIFNATAPQIANMSDVFKAIKKQKNYWVAIHAPAFMLKIIMGELAIEVLKSSHVVSDKITEHGYRFQYGQLDTCMQDLLR